MFSKFLKKCTLGHLIVQELAPAPPVLQFANPSPPPGHMHVIVIEVTAHKRIVIYGTE